MNPDVILDCFGLLCPMPIIKTAEKIKELKSGQTLEILSTDEGIEPDIQAWAKATGNEYLGIEKKNGEYRAFVRKA